MPQSQAENRHIYKFAKKQIFVTRPGNRLGGGVTLPGNKNPNRNAGAGPKFSSLAALAGEHVGKKIPRSLLLASPSAARSLKLTGKGSGSHGHVQWVSDDGLKVQVLPIGETTAWSMVAPECAQLHSRCARPRGVCCVTPTLAHRAHRDLRGGGGPSLKKRAARECVFMVM